jgi:ubiquinone/menaquinone biosynthesis C-methylase UbiE
MPETITKLAYQAFQNGKSAFSLGHRTLATQLRQWLRPELQFELEALDDDFLAEVTRRREALLQVDWDEAEAGIYPEALLFDNPWDDFFQYYPAVVWELPQLWERILNQETQVFDATINTQGFPRYYLQNFHHQTDGYLSETSANLYDLQVELLFSGSADAMRRRVLAPIKQALNQQAALGDSHQPQRVLDVACGTGRMLKQLQGSFPDVSLYGVDLSPAYLRKANQLLSQPSGSLPQLAQGQGEAMPYRDDYFNALTCVFLFHELPGPVRQQVINDCFRVTQPGGTLVICDSIQAIDTPELEPMMANFPVLFHEPYYRDYIQDDLTARLETAGFTAVTTQAHFVSKYWIAHKPA